MGRTHNERVFAAGVQLVTLGYWRSTFTSTEQHFAIYLYIKE